MNATARNYLERALRSETQHLEMLNEAHDDLHKRLVTNAGHAAEARARIADLRATLDSAPLVIDCTPVDGIV